MLKEFHRLTGFDIFDRLHESFGKYSDLILKRQTSTGKGRLDALRAEISATMTEKEKTCEFTFRRDYIYNLAYV